MSVTWKERRSAGRLLRKTVPRSAHAEWSGAPERQDPVETLLAQAESRVPELMPIRHGRMASSAFAFFRGAAAVMAADLATTPTTGLHVQACGDAHVSNFGKFATPERNVVFDINDFDETLPAPWEWDVKRLAASLHVVARERGFTSGQCNRVVNAAMRDYRQRVAELAVMSTLDLWYAQTSVDDVVAHFPARYRPLVLRDVTKAQRKDHVRAVAKLTGSVDGSVQFVEDPPLLVHLANTEHDIGDVAPMIDSYRANLTDSQRDLFDRFHVVDVARKVVGVGSVGTRCWVCLFEGPHHPKGDRIVLQVKEAQASVLEPYAGASGLDHHGRRVVAGQRITQGASDAFLGWCGSSSTGNAYYVRQLWDTKGQGDPMRMSLGYLTYYGALCAEALARAHARTGDAVQISGYLGKSDVFDRAIVEFAAKYSRTNETDHRALLTAIEDQRVEALSGV